MLKNFEGLRLHAYKDAVGVWTIGYGHTGPDVYPGQVITEPQAEALLKGDVKKFEQGVQNLLARAANQPQFDGLVLLAYNIGLGAFAQSTLLARFNAGDIEGAARQFGEWVLAGGQILRGLVRRRFAEAVRFMAHA